MSQYLLWKSDDYKRVYVHNDADFSDCDELAELIATGETHT
jgi:hypothetical protein